MTVLEKEEAVGRHQTGNNSGVLHCGLYYKPGSVKARLAVGGIRQMVEFCRENDIPHEICGKLVVAAERERSARASRSARTRHGERAGGPARLGREEMREIEPHVGGVAALRVPQEGIVDYPRVCAVLAGEDRTPRTARVVTGARVTRLRQPAAGMVADTGAAISRRIS